MFCPDDVQVVQLEELGEVEHEQDPDTRDARPSAVVVATFQSRREPSPYKPVKCSAGHVVRSKAPMPWPTSRGPGVHVVNDLDDDREEDETFIVP